MKLTAVMAIDGQDNLYVGDLITHDVFKLTPGAVETLYGNANFATSTSRLTAIGFDGSGNLYCGTYGNGTGRIKALYH